MSESPAGVQERIDLLLTTLDVRDPYTLCHGKGVGEIARLIAAELGLSDEQVERVRVAGELHDIGKIGVPEAIATKPGRMTREEYEVVKGHSRIGHDLLVQQPDLADVAPIVLYHHEYWGGGGYPEGLAGEEIPLEARIICLADCYDAMTTDRPYRDALSGDAASEEINRLAGTQFCPQVVAAFNRIRGQIPENRLAPRAQQAAARPLSSEAETSSTLDALEVGESCVVVRVDGDIEFRRRLLELGLVPGARAELVRRAPLGDPLEVDVRGSSFFLRRDEARSIHVCPADVGQQELVKRLTGPLSLHAPVSRRFNVAVAGNPNTGKTTLFNALTGADGHVGNYPGITVDRLSAELDLDDNLVLSLVDVPGTYSLNARSRDEQVAMDEILGRAGSPRPDLVLVVLNAATLERSLYLMLQIQELGLPVVAAANMMDEAWDRGLQIDTDVLARELGVPVVGVVARTGQGLDELREALRDSLRGGIPPLALGWRWQPSDDLIGHLDGLLPSIGDLLGPDAVLSARRAMALWCLMSIDERDELEGIPPELRETTLAYKAEMAQEGHDLDLEVTRKRYDRIDAIVADATRRPMGRGQRNLTRRIDSVLTHPLYGLLAFVVVMGLVFAGVFDWAAPMMDGIEWAVGQLAAAARHALPEGLLADLVVDGVIAGVGSVVVFLPQILILFAFIAVLETSGYLSRTAFMVDRLMRKLGLNGKSFVPMLSGFACAVPAIMATRTLDSRRDRMITMMVIPLISCSARLPVYTLVIAALFPADRSLLGPINVGTAMMLGLYLLATLIALGAAGVLGRTLFKGKSEPMLLELPPYRLPPPREVGRVLWQRSMTFLRTAGTVILLASIALWALLSFPRVETYSTDYAAAIAAASARGDEARVELLENRKRAEELEHSLAGRLGKAIEPAIRPLGFDWKIGVGLVGSIAAREVFVSTLGQVYAVGEADEESSTLRESMRRQRHEDGSPVYTPLTGLSILVFFMLALQCLSTVAVVKQEAGKWRWVVFQLFYTTALAYLGSLAVYQIGRLLGYS